MTMKKIIAYALLGSVVLSSCQKYLDVNTNPNTATVTKANFVFANALNSAARTMVGGMHITSGHWDGMYGHSTSFTGGGQEKTYVFTNGDFNYWNGVYDNLNDLQYVINHASADGFPYMVGPSMIVQVMMWQKLVDLYGNVPYTEALQGTAFSTPKYDDAATIYQSLTAKLTQAVNLINASSFPSNDPSDIFFNASALRWKQFANTLKLRLIVRRSNVSGYNAAADIATISPDGFIDAPVYCNPGYLKTQGKLNWYYANWGFNENDAPTGDFRKMGKPIIEFLKASGDIFRLSRIASVKGDPNNSTSITDPASQNPSNYLGIPLGGVNTGSISYLSANVSAMGRMQIKVGDATRPVVIMTDAESFLLQAEAKQRGWLSGSAPVAYNEGVRRDFNFVANVGTAYATATAAQADAAAAAYLSSGYPYADWNASPDKLKAIWVQKWIALVNVDGSEAWAEYRRTNSPSNPNGNIPDPFTAQSEATTSAQPLRLFYPLVEYNNNGSNVPLNGNSYVFTTRIFWDVN